MSVVVTSHSAPSPYAGRPIHSPFVKMDARGVSKMKAGQRAFWDRLLAAGGGMTITEDSIVAVTDRPAFLDEIAKYRLYEPGQTFEQILGCGHKVPRLTALALHKGVPVGMGLLMPTIVEYCGTIPPPLKYGHKVGLLGVYVAPDHRGQGFAKRVLSSIGRSMERGIRKAPLCAMASPSIVDMCRDLIPIPVLAR